MEGVSGWVFCNCSISPFLRFSKYSLLHYVQNVVIVLTEAVRNYQLWSFGREIPQTFSDERSRELIQKNITFSSIRFVL